MNRLRKLVEAFEVTVGQEGLAKSQQAKFPSTTKCLKCSGLARHAFTAKEFSKGEPGDTAVVDLHRNDPEGEGYWPHDVVAVAVYFCTKCMEPVALANQN